MIVGLVPMRSGSKRIPDKNILHFLGRPLYWWVCSALENSPKVNFFVVSSDSDDYLKDVKMYGFSKAVYHKRSEETSQDDASTESVIKEVIDYYDLLENDYLLLTQTTSPWVTSSEIGKFLNAYNQSKALSFLSVARTNKFIWDKEGHSINYNFYNRPKSQDFKSGLFIENGGVYINSVQNILASSNRLTMPIGIYRTPFWTAHEIDTQEDWIMLEQIMKVKGYI